MCVWDGCPMQPEWEREEQHAWETEGDLPWEPERRGRPGERPFDSDIYPGKDTPGPEEQMYREMLDEDDEDGEG